MLFLFKIFRGKIKASYEKGEYVLKYLEKLLAIKQKVCDLLIDSSYYYKTTEH